MTPAVLAAPALVAAIEQSADPNLARAVLTRLVDEQPQLADELAGDDRLRAALVALSVASRSLSSAVVADPSLLDPLRDDGDFLHEHAADDYRRAFAEFVVAHDDGRAALRRWKRRELLRIAARDLLGRADLPVVGRELAGLAEACLDAAVGLAAPEARLTVIGMGKLGGRELNYSSDVDVLFVHDGDTAAAGRAARRILEIMSGSTTDGIVFRTDANLRPEGRSGPLSRSLESYESYYERWAQTWEFQALIKARPVAGDQELGTRFLEIAQRNVWRDVLDPDAVHAVRAMKARSEELVSHQGLTEREVKRGRGGIRDIEFSVQLLQLVHGRHDPAVRSPTTLEALAQLAAGGYVDHDDAERLERAYNFLRTVEHRLQLQDEQQTHTLPADPDARTRLARVLGYRDRGGDSALARFEHDYRRHQADVRSIHERLFFAPILETLAGAGRLTPAAVEERLAAFGFRDARHTRAALRELTQGLTRRSRVMQQLLPVVLEWLSRTPNPDLGLLQLRRLVERPARSEALAKTFRDSPGAAERAVRLLGSSRVAGDALRRHPEFVESLGDDATMARERTPSELLDEARQTLDWRGDPEERREGLRRFKRRELLRIAARDLLGFATVESTGRELAGLADACVAAALHGLEPTVPVAVIGMGRLGGNELSYASDIDVLFVYDGDSAVDFAAAEHTAEALMKEIGAITPEGQTFRIDANLRPEGRQGQLARSLSGYATYYDRWALTWEFQALIKARPMAGDPELGRRFRALVEPYVYRDPFPEDEVREVRRMKARIERERIPPDEDPQFHLKLGRGSLSDVEFTAQLLQLMHGARRPEIREAATIPAIACLRDVGLLAPADADALEEAYRYCERARNALYLLTGKPGDALPTDGVTATRLARLLGYDERPQASLRDDYRRVTRRSRRVVERVLYGRD